MQTPDTHAHAMTLTTTHPSGAQEWECPICGRKFVMQLSPNFKRVILVEGDAYATHTTGTSELRMTAVQIARPTAEQNEIAAEQLDVWLDHINDIDFDALPDESDDAKK